MKIARRDSVAKNNRLFYEKKYWRAGFEIIIGVDEAGRGPLAGPVAAGAVALLGVGGRDNLPRRLFENVDDSKKLSARKREELFEIIVNCEKIIWASALVWPRTIDRINIFEASKLAMARAAADIVRGLKNNSAQKLFCLVDGNFPIKVPYPQKSIVSGDAKVFSISAASIVAKVIRDRVMRRLDKKYPAYGFARHKGYPTKEHLVALRWHGLSPVHRLSFGPCAVLQRKAIIKSYK
ncbi:MAG: ribonuclease HII [Minisyncoccales bacterium]